MQGFVVTVFRWCSHEGFVLGCGYTAFTFEVVLSSPISYAILSFATDVNKTFQANIRLSFSLKMNSNFKLLQYSLTTIHSTAVLTSGSECSDSC